MPTMLHKRHHTVTNERWLQWWGEWTNKLLKSEIVKVIYSFCSPSFLMMPSIKSSDVWRHPCGLAAVNRIANELVQVVLVLRLHSVFPLPSTILLQLPPSVISSTIDERKPFKSVCPLHVCYLSLFYYNQILPFSWVSCVQSQSIYFYLVFYICVMKLNFHDTQRNFFFFFYECIQLSMCVHTYIQSSSTGQVAEYDCGRTCM